MDTHLTAIHGGRKGRILIVGAGFAGAVHARVLAEAGYNVEVIDKRPHIAGNAFDEVDDNGVRVHRYGPHLFHTNQDHVVDWLTRFAQFVPYEHRVRAVLDDGRFVPLPVNLDTINMVYDLQLANAAAAKAFLASVAVPIPAPRNAGEHLYANIGQRLTDLFFRPYTRKMWALDLEDMDAAVVKRLPIRFDRDDRYFDGDKHQFLPERGYTDLFERIFDHSSITVRTSVVYEPGAEKDYVYCFNSMPIDVFFDFCFGELPYRSIQFETSTRLGCGVRDWSSTNFTDDRPQTRETWWHCLPNHVVTDTGRASITLETPCDYRDNAMERYYPVKTADGRYQTLYGKYKDLAETLPNMQFIGRCGTYQYLDMDQVINQSLVGVQRWLKAQS
jgi:UDP-galactopyranose mutase